MMLLFLSISVAFSLIISVNSNAPRTSIEDLNSLLKADGKIVKILQRYLKRTTDEEIIKIVLRYINTSQRFTEVPDPFYHPINGLHFLKHAVYNWRDVDAALRADSSSLSARVNYTVAKILTTDQYPYPQDVFHGAGNIGRMQYFYQLSMEKLVQGKVENGLKGQVFQSIEPLNSWDCNEIGKALIKLNKYEKSMEWFSIAKDKVVAGDSSSDIETISKNEEEAKEKMETWVSPVEESLQIDTDEEFAERANNPSFKNYIEDNSKRLLEPMAALCRGETIKLKIPKPILSCRYFTGDHAFYKLAQLKLEELSKQPPMVWVHNFMVEEEMEKLVEGASKKNARTSAPLKIVIKKLETKIQAAFGVQIVGLPSDDEAFVKNYGIAGAHLPHFDYLKGHKGHPDQFPATLGDRIATFLAYIGNVTYGGRTVFPLAGVSVPPERGSAIFWFNTYKSEEGDLLTMHASCPVLYGSKWVFNKWIKTYNQMFKFPCGTEYLERFQLF